MKSGLHFLQQYWNIWLNLWDIMIVFHLHGFISDFVSRNTFGIEKAFCFELRNCTLSSDMATNEVTLTWVWRLCEAWFFRYQKCHFGVTKIFGILFGKYFELRKSTWASKCTYIRVSDFQIWRFNSEVHLRYYYFCPKFVKNCSKTSQICMASLLTIYGIKRCAKIEVIYICRCTMKHV